MTEDDGRAATRRLVGADGFARLKELCDLVLTENGRQNLIARSTEPTMWVRHILDSVQLLRFAPDNVGPWLDVGTGGGFPGLAIAAADPTRSMILAEPRKRRADFLHDAAHSLGLCNVRVEQRRVESLTVTASVISARAVAPVEKLLQAAGHCATPTTRWLLLRGQSDINERPGMFHVEQSLTDPASHILVANGGVR